MLPVKAFYRFVFAGLVAAATGCSLWMLDDDAYTAGNATPPEAGPEEQPGADGGRPDDAGSVGSGDAQVEAEASAPFCAALTDATFCDDFDGEGLAVMWDTVTNKTDYAHAPILDPSNAVSHPNSVRMQLLPLPGSKAASAGVERKTGKSPTSSAQFSFDVFFDQVDASASVSYARLTFGYEPPNDRYTLSLYLENGIAYLVEEKPISGKTTKHKFTKNVRLREWSRIAIEATVNPPQLTVTLDDATVVAPVTPMADSQFGPVAAFVGFSHASGTKTALRVHYDNVQLDVN